MIISIFATDCAGGIGKYGSLPWPKNAEDLKHFKKHTFGHVVVMGGNTWRDPCMPKPLPGRLNAVVTTSTIDVPGAVTISGDVKQSILHIAANHPTQDVFIIGGAQLLNSTIDIVDKVILTQFAEDYQCDTVIDLAAYLDNFTVVEATYNKTGAYISIWEKNI